MVLLSRWDLSAKELCETHSFAFSKLQNPKVQSWRNKVEPGGSQKHTHVKITDVSRG